MLNDLGAGTGRGTSVQDAGGGQIAHRIGIRQPPLRPFAAGLVQFEHAVGLRPTKVQCDATTGNDRPHAVVHGTAVFGLVETQVQPTAQEVARLRDTASDAVADGFGNRVRRTGIIGLRFLEERAQIAPRSKADAQYVRVSGGERDLIQPCGIEAAFQTNLGRIGGAGERIARIAARPCPIACGNQTLIDNLAALRFARTRH